MGQPIYARPGNVPPVKKNHKPASTPMT